MPSSRLQKTIVSDCHEISQYLHWVSLHKYIDALAFCPGTKISPPWKHFNLENQEMFLILFYLYLVVLSLFFTLSLVWKVSWKLCYEVCFTNVLGYRWSVVDWRAGALDTALEITERSETARPSSRYGGTVSKYLQTVVSRSRLFIHASCVKNARIYLSALIRDCLCSHDLPKYHQPAVVWVGHKYVGYKH